MEDVIVYNCEFTGNYGPWTLKDLDGDGDGYYVAGNNSHALWVRNCQDTVINACDFWNNGYSAMYIYMGSNYPSTWTDAALSIKATLVR